MSVKTGMTVDDVVTALHDMSWIAKDQNGDYMIDTSASDLVVEWWQKSQKKVILRAKPENLRWVPFGVVPTRFQDQVHSGTVSVQ
jgi:hypothetical protein